MKCLLRSTVGGVGNQSSRNERHHAKDEVIERRCVKSSTSQEPQGTSRRKQSQQSRQMMVLADRRVASRICPAEVLFVQQCGTSEAMAAETEMGRCGMDSFC